MKAEHSKPLNEIIKISVYKSGGLYAQAEVNLPSFVTLLSWSGVQAIAVPTWFNWWMNCYIFYIGKSNDSGDFVVDLLRFLNMGIKSDNKNMYVLEILQDMICHRIPIFVSGMCKLQFALRWNLSMRSWLLECALCML